MFNATALTPRLIPTLTKLAALKPRTLAIMHGASFAGDCVGALEQLGAYYAQRITPPNA